MRLESYESPQRRCERDAQEQVRIQRDHTDRRMRRSASSTDNVAELLEVGVRPYPDHLRCSVPASADPRPHSTNSPRSTVSACPPSSTRSPSNCTRRTPPRRDTWCARNSSFPNRSLPKCARQQCAEPVTGSSSIPDCGARKRDTKSTPAVDARLVTITPRAGTVCRRLRSGSSVRSVRLSSISTR
jgi:hypothetical protein